MASQKAVFKDANYGENKHNNDNTTTHAESDLINKLSFRHKDKKNKKNKKKYKLIIIKVSRLQKKIGMSKPCEKCIIMLKNLELNSGIKISKIIYTTENGSIIQTNLQKLLSMNDHHISSYYKNTGYVSHLNNNCNCDDCDDCDDEEDDDEDG